ncbi:hypothetical protein GGI13_007483, partial [Coemansia sp. RSA 455]
FAHPLGLVPGTRVVVRDARLDVAKGSGRPYLRGVAATSFQTIAAKQAPDSLVQAPSQATRDAETERVSIGQIYGQHISKATFHCNVSTIERLHISVACKECKQAVCEMLCACAGRRHKIATNSATMLVSIELCCRVADGSGVARLVVSDEATLAETLGLSATEVTELFSLAARSSDGQLLWMPQQEEHDIEANRIISRAAAAMAGGKIFQPSTKIRLTNVSIVRLRKGGKRFEVACYKNKVTEWRTGVEKDIDEVLQIHQIYVNVSKGQVAKTEELRKCFNTEDVDEVIKEVLMKGEQQVSDKERHHQLDNMLRDIATVVAEKCVNPATQQPYTVTMIEKIMADIHYSVNPNRSAKQQALDVIKQIQEQNTVPISRAQMRIRISMPRKDAKRLREKILELVATIEDEERDEGGGEEYEQVCLIDPGQYRAVTELISGVPKGAGTVEILSLRDINDEDSTLN